MAHIIQSRPDSGLDCKVKVLNGLGCRGTHPLRERARNGVCSDPRAVGAPGEDVRQRFRAPLQPGAQRTDLLLLHGRRNF